MPEKKKPKKILTYILVLAALIAVVCGLLYLMQSLQRNYASEASHSFEKALTNAGAVKRCDAGDNGRGPDNQRPWYSGIYEVPGNMTAATELIKNAAKESGYALVGGDLPGNPEDNEFYKDHISKMSNYSELDGGSVKLDVEIFGSKKYDKQGSFCAVTSGSVEGRTTINFMVTLPEYR